MKHVHARVRFPSFRVALAGALVVGTFVLLSSSRATSSQDAGDDTGAEVLSQADRQFAADVAAGGLDAWVGWFTSDAVKFGIEGDTLVRGHAAIAEADAALFADPDRRLSWEPDLAGWLEPDQRGFTRGGWRLVGLDDAGAETTLASGRYLTLWVRTDAGWRVELDVGVPG